MQYKITNIKTTPKATIAVVGLAVLGLAGLAVAMLASADFAAETFATSLDSQVKAEINGNRYITLTTPDVALSLTPTSGAQTTSTASQVQASTNASGGISLYLSMTGSTNDLFLGGDTTSTHKITATTSTGSLASLPTNSWGYSTNNSTYQAVPTTASSPALLGTIAEGAAGSDTSGTLSVYYGMKVDSTLAAGTYGNSVTYSAVVGGGTVSRATLESIRVGGETVTEMQPGVQNVITVATDLKTNVYGTPRAYLTTSEGAQIICAGVVAGQNDEGFLTVQCSVTPTNPGTGVVLHIVTPGSADDPFCGSGGVFDENSSACEPGNWQWGNFTVALPDIVTPGPDIDRPATSWKDLEIMQHMTPEICADASVGDTKQLIDWRDKKTYWVAKLADKNCWMTQNLDLDLVSGQALDADLTDIDSDWNPGATTFTSANQGSTSYTAVQSWDLGQAVWKTPTSDSYCSPSTNLYDSSCSAYWQNVSDTNTWSPMTKYRTDGVVIEGKTYDAHYLAGNYYSFQAATAGTAPTSSGTASGSICPKGFTLPTSNTTSNGSFSNLITQTSANANTIVQAPLMFVRGGNVDPGDSLDYAGLRGYSRSSVSGGSNYAYSLFFYSGRVYPSDNDARYYGQSVRCVAVSA